jgi:hypothetical protein
MQGDRLHPVSRLRLHATFLLSTDVVYGHELAILHSASGLTLDDFEAYKLSGLKRNNVTAISFTWHQRNNVISPHGRNSLA